MGLAACGGGDETSDTAAPAAPAATTTTSAAAPAATEAAPAADAPDDKTVCEGANKAADSFKKAIMVFASSGSGEIPAADAKVMYQGFAKDLTAAAGGSTTEVGKAVTLIATQATTASESKDPVNDGDTPEAEKAGKALNEACKDAGVKTNF